jgi:hypothetical protein
MWQAKFPYLLQSFGREEVAQFLPNAHPRLGIVLNSFTVFSIGVDLTQTAPIEIGSKSN